MEQEKIVQIAMSESSDVDGGGTLHVLALSNTGRIFKGGDISNSQYKYEFGWKELPCPIKQTAPCKHLRRKDKGSWEKCLDCGENATTYLEDSDAGLLEPSQVF